MDAEGSSSPSAMRNGLHFPAGQEAMQVNLLPDELLDSGSAEATVVFGKEASIIIASRNAGYHSKPHAHRAEQFNYIISGRAWVFVEQQGYLVRPGDILRIPSGAVHWAWVFDEAPVSVLEVHTPPLTGDYSEGRIALGLSEEEEADVDHSSNEWVADISWQEIERRIVGSSYEDECAK